MRKTDKKIDNQLRSELTDVCEQTLQRTKGFSWLTHLVNYNRFPSSLKVVCIFDTNESLDRFLQSAEKAVLETLIKTRLSSIGIAVNAISKHVEYDTEENCEQYHQGNWARRLED